MTRKPEAKKAIEKRTAAPLATIGELLDSKSLVEQLTRALPKHMSAYHLLRVARTAIEKSRKLLECTPLSVLSCLMECAQLGLEPDGILGHAYLVPFKSKVTGKTHAQLIVGYRGFIDLAYRSDQVAFVSAEIVRAADVFEVSLGTQRTLRHKPMPAPPKDGPDDWQGAYAVVELKTGHKDFEWMERADIERIRRRSPAANEGPWITDPEWMWRKTSIRQLSKRMPLSTQDHRLVRAAVIDEYGERGLLAPTPTGFELLPAEESPPIAEPKRVLPATEPEPTARSAPVAEAHGPQPPEPPAAPAELAKPSGRKITEGERIHLYQIAADRAQAGDFGFDDVREVVTAVVRRHGIDRPADLPIELYEQVCGEVQAFLPKENMTSPKVGN